MKKKLTSIVTVCAASLFIFSGSASAHVVVFPQQTMQGTYEKFSVRVPSEKDVPTVKVKVEIPKDVEISRFEPMPGWRYSIEKDSTGLIKSVTWTAEGKGIAATEFTEFNMQGKVGDKAKKIVWKAYQKYKDGSTVAWEGPESSETPASVTQVMKGNGDAHGHMHGAMDDEEKETDDDQDNQDNSSLPLYLSGAALLLSLISLVLSARKRR
ncbi:YcnI family protein [Fictibacillus sp. NRS-1165]|uniref:YcnI family copper-binding membrane protein n=1 Tax=Fictibacillus sp. NRS-1165 TaxID=3144463 RepID=UPI003D22473E